MKRPLKLFPIGSRSLGAKATTELVPQSRMAGPIPWVIAIMVMLTVIAAAGGLALRNIASAASAELSGGVTIQIVEARPEVRQAQAQRALAALSQAPGVREARLVPQDEVDAMIEPWLGAGIADAEVPVPAMIDARLEGAADTVQVNALRARLTAVAPAARVDAQSGWLKPVFAAISSLQWLALALVLLLAMATGAAVLLATRTALGANRETIEIVHLLGGTDQQIARIFQTSSAKAAAEGGIAGIAAAVIVVIVLGRQFGQLGAGIVTGGALGWFDWVMLALVPFIGVALAVLTARWTVLRALARML